jgi:pimeloyl-ACP methyl ester carboxylesterase
MIDINEYAKERKSKVTDFTRVLAARRASTTLEVCYEPVKIDYRFILHRESMSNIPILFLTGWGSGWEGITSLAFSVYAERHDVILWSPPGYGSSGNPPKDFYDRHFFAQAANTLSSFLGAIGVLEVHLVGHSMGAEILAKFASNYGGRTKSLTLIAPSGALEVPRMVQKAFLMANFAISGARLRREDKRERKNINPVDDYLRPLIDLCGKQKSSFFDWKFERIKQRWYEFRELCQTNLGENIRSVACPMLAILGSLDTVYPAYMVENEIRRAMAERGYSDEMLKIKILAGMHHNPTLFRPEEAARIISEFIKAL